MIRNDRAVAKARRWAESSGRMLSVLVREATPEEQAEAGLNRRFVCSVLRYTPKPEPHPYAAFLNDTEVMYKWDDFWGWFSDAEGIPTTIGARSACEVKA